MTKAEIVKLALRPRARHGLTISCYDPARRASPAASATRASSEERAFAEAGVVETQARGDHS